VEKFTKSRNVKKRLLVNLAVRDVVGENLTSLTNTKQVRGFIVRVAVEGILMNACTLQRRGLKKPLSSVMGFWRGRAFRLFSAFSFFENSIVSDKEDFELIWGEKQANQVCFLSPLIGYRR
jgi:hypothetical protein